MKLKKILAQSLAAAMVLTSIPVANFTVFAAEDAAAYVSDDAGTAGDTAGTADATETDALPAPYGYKNLQLTVNEDVEVTTAKSPNTAVGTNILTNSDEAFLAISADTSEPWINFHFKQPQTVAGFLYYLTSEQANGYVKFAKVEVKTEGSDTYQKVYENETAWEKSNITHAALFTPVSQVTDVKFYGISIHGSYNNLMHIRKMRIVTVPEDAALVTATASTSNEELGTVTVDVTEAKGRSNTVQVIQGVPVKYQATATEAGEFVEWRDDSGKIISRDATYTTTAEEDTALTAVFRDAYYEKIDQNVLKANAKDNSHDSSNNDMPATAAFDGNDQTLWHQNYGNGAGSQKKPSASNPIWIQTSFGTENEKNKVETVGSLTYRGRPDDYKPANGGVLATRISDYVILAACKEKGSPEAGDWAVVKAGTMSSNISAGNAVETITFTPVKATHIRLVALSAYNSESYVCAGEINLYRVKDTSARVSELEDISKNTGIENGTVTILPPGYMTTDDSNADAANGESASVIGKYLSGTTRNVTLWAIPNSGYLFDKWTKGAQVSSVSQYFMTNTDESRNYKPNFILGSENYTQIGITQDQVKANSYMNGTTGDGSAWCAFDNDTNDTNRWHSCYNTSNGHNDAGINGTPSKTNKIWIQAGFGESKKFRKLTYRSRTDNTMCIAKDYEILVANKTEGEPTDDDFAVAYRGVFDGVNTEQTVILPFAVNATHVRLRVSSVHGNSSYVTASKITLWSEDAANNVGAITDVPSVSSNDASLGTVETDVKKMIDAVDTNIKITATPASGCHFVKWLITDADGVTTEKSTAVLNEVVNSQSQYSYRALFAKDAEVSVSLDQTYVTMTAGDAATLTATVKNATNSEITWATDAENVATFENGVITAVGAGEATITATSVEDNTKSATCTVVVNAAPSTEALKALVTEAMAKTSDGKKYSTESSNKLAEEIKIARELFASTDSAAIAAEEVKLRAAMNNLVELYKVTIKSDGADLSDLILTAVDGDGEDPGSNSTGKWIYVPMFSRVKVTAPGMANDADFAQWQIPSENPDENPDGKVMCTTTSYTFYVVDEIILEASYLEAEPAVTIFCAGRYLTSLGKISFVAKRSVDKSYRVIEHGIIITDEKGWTDLYDGNENAMVKGATRTKKSVAKGTANNGVYEARLKAGKKEKWYGRSYVTYTDGDTTYTEYSKVAEYKNK